MRKWLLFILVPCVLLAGCAASAENAGLTVVFYSVEKADAILIYTENSAVLIDAGKNEHGKQIAEDIHSRGIEHLDAMIITHFDKDHVGGADKILKNISVGRVFEASYEKDSRRVQQYREALEAAGLEAEALAENICFEVDGCAYAIDVGNEETYDKENDYSLVVRLTYGDVRFLFTGDAENERLGELIAEDDLKCDVLKVPHHGSYHALSGLFFEEAKPKYAVITSGEERLEDERTVQELELVGSRVLLTREAAVEMKSDGTDIWLVGE